MARITVVVSVSLPPEMVAELDLVCKIEHRTRSELIREALRRYYDRRHGERGDPEHAPSSKQAIRRISGNKATDSKRRELLFAV